MTGGRASRREVLLLAAAVLVAGWAPAARADLVEVVPRIKPSIVAVGTLRPVRNPAFRFRGTGFAVGDGHLIATCAHVVQDDLAGKALESLAVIDGNGGPMRRATRLAVDKERDLALLRIGGPALPPLTLAEGDPVSEGQAVAFTGFPIGDVLGLAPVTHRGIVSAITPVGIPQSHAQALNPTLIRALGSEVFHLYQLDATAYPGNSGSPVFYPESGEVLGVVNMVFVKRTKESALSDPSGISYAIPARYLKAMLDGPE